MSIDEIKRVVRQSVVKVINHEAFSNSENLLNISPQIVPANFLYIFDLIEKELCTTIYEVFNNSTYEMMSVDNISLEIKKIIDKDEFENQCQTII